ncbi:kinase-like domain-containing protein [Elsinoe ampelina]|uniref:Kinase-like domain-containing protein n=1 Tax=Elsinoe ampelina TaxID=302913 RepID=A0A6A6G353_9PEZI|nr:kinase-like domain-containing protein [Elsinoe ampelina]
MLCEVTDVDTGSFKRTTFAYLDSEDVFYFGSTTIPKLKMKDEDFLTALKKVPDEDIYPLPTENVTIFRGESDEKLYVKRPKMTWYDDLAGSGVIAQLLMDEIKVTEVISKHPHPNLIGYHGCLLRRGFIAGLVLDKYHTTLEKHVNDKKLPIDIGSIMAGIKAGVQHLHSLGLAHNDINPMNILLDEEQRPIIIDFGSCKAFGEELLSAGTPGWVEDELCCTSLPQSDDYGIAKIRSWLEEHSRTW